MIENNIKKDKKEYKQKPKIAIPNELKGLLDNIKVHPRERYEDVIQRLAEQVVGTMKIMNKQVKDQKDNGDKQ